MESPRSAQTTAPLAALSEQGVRAPALAANYDGFYSRRPLGDGRCSKWLATHGCVNGIEDAQAIDIRHSTDGDRIAEIQDLAIRVGERGPRGKTRAVRIAR